MLLLSTIPKAPSADPGLDQQRLFAQGLEHVRTLTWRRWTDHNVHDPGITILELLSYALTDVAYRASFPVEDLLATSSDPVQNAAGMARQFFTAGQILPNRALTALDYRKLLIDLPGVKNAWVLPVELKYFADTIQATLLRERPAKPGIREVEVRGLYRVLLDYMDSIVKPEQQEEVKARARTLLAANRNLCEEFVQVDGIETESFILCTELELEPNADTAQVQAEVLFRVGRWLDPPVHNYSLDEMLALPHADGSRRTVEEIFDGPLLKNGFIDGEELERAELRTAIHLSDVIRVIMDVEGVRAVRGIEINPQEITAPLADKWQVAVTPGKRPALLREGSRLVLYKRNMPVVPPAAAVAEHFASLEAAERKKLEEGTAGDLPIPLGRYRRPAVYTSFQNDFPALYGLSEAGPPAGADVRRQALVKQLKGYLLFFDQAMANACAQLGALPDLFSTDPDLSHTYFTQMVETLTDFKQIYQDGFAAENLAGITEDPATFAERRNRFLDHLTARFAERFHDY
ncbi:MAG TPA: diguanylate cyclase, partial [Thermoanaerobaculia bacterium]